jgi:hypothetical protein
MMGRKTKENDPDDVGRRKLADFAVKIPFCKVKVASSISLWWYFSPASVTSKKKNTNHSEKGLSRYIRILTPER